MYGKDHEDTLGSLLRTYCGEGAGLVFTDDLASWCAATGAGAPEPDAPLRIVENGEEGIRLGVLEVIPDDAVDSRVKALSVRWSLQDVQNNLAEKLDSEKKRLAYILMREIASRMPDLDDELVADNWIFGEMRARGLFRE